MALIIGVDNYEPAEDIMKSRSEKTGLPYSLMLLTLTLVAATFSHGGLAIPFVTWLLPIFALQFIERQKSPIGFVLLWLTMSLGNSIAFAGIIPEIPKIFHFFIISGATLILMVPYLLHSLFAHRIYAFLSTLIFPLGMVLIEFFMILVSPYGSWTSYAYSQFNNKIFMQLVSITGITGIVFIMAWFGSVVNWVINHKFKWERIRTGLFCYCLVLVLVTAYGAARLGFRSPVIEKSVRVALIAKDTHALEKLIPILNREEKITPEELAEIELMMEQGNDFLFEKTAREAKAGAKIVVWSEKAGFFFKEDEMRFIERAKRAAKRSNIYLCIGAQIIADLENKEGAENKAYTIGPDGELLVQYTIGRMPYFGPKIEDRYFEKKNKQGKIFGFNSEYGKIAIVICNDGAHPRYILQLSKDEPDIVISHDATGYSITPRDNHIHSTRAIEHGYTFIMAATRGVSMVIDPYGRIISYMNYWTTSPEERVLVAQIPLQKRVFTTYSVLGDLFSYLSILGLLVIIALAIKSNPQRLLF